MKLNLRHLSLQSVTIDLERQQSLSLHEMNPFDGIEHLMQWLTEIHLSERSLNEFQVPDNVQTLLKAGDVHYYRLYVTEKLFPDEYSENVESLLTSVVYEILELERIEEHIVSVRRDLWNFITRELGRKIAKGCESFDIGNITKLWNRGPRNSEYHAGLLEELDYENISTVISDYYYPYEKTTALEGITFLGRVNEGRKYTDIELTLDPGRNCSLLQRIRELTRDVDYVEWDENLNMNVSMGYHLSPNVFLAWLNSFPWFIMQATVIARIDDLDFLRELIVALHQTDFEQKYPLLLFCTDCYLVLVRRFTVNLWMASGCHVGQNKSLIAARAAEIIQHENTRWSNGGITNSIDAIWASAIDFNRSLNNQYLVSLFELASEEHVSKWINQNAPPVITEAINHGRQYFVSQIMQHSSTPAFLKSHFKAENIDWNRICLLKSTSDQLREKSFQNWLQIVTVDYIKSHAFSWHAEYTLESIDRVQCFSSIILGNPKWKNAYQQLSNDLKACHDGWQYDSSDHFKRVIKEVFIFSVGFYIACELFDSGAVDQANNLLDESCASLVDQIRNSLSDYYASQYKVVIMLYVKICLHYKNLISSPYLEKIPDVIDDLELILPVAGLFNNEVSFDSIPGLLTFVIKIKNRFENELPFLELKYQDHQPARLNKIRENWRLWKNINV